MVGTRELLAQMARREMPVIASGCVASAEHSAILVLKIAFGYRRRGGFFVDKGV